MAPRTFTIYIHIRWWVRAYVAGIRITAMITGLQPDMAKVDKTIGWLLRHGGVVLVAR